MLQAYNGACCIFIMGRKQDLLNLMGGRLKDTDTHQKLKEAFQASLLPLRGRFYESKNYKTKETKDKAGGFRGHAVTCSMRRGARHGASALGPIPKGVRQGCIRAPRAFGSFPASGL